MDYQTPTWVTVAVGVVTLIGGALLGMWAKWRRTQITLKGEDNKVTIEGSRARIDLEAHVRDDAVQQWKNMADFAAKRANEADARADKKEEECQERLEKQAARYREREAAMIKQMQDREIQFQEIADGIRKDLGAKIDTLARQHEDCIRENGMIKGRISEMERRQTELEAKVESNSPKD